MGRGLAAPLPQAESSAVEENYPMWVMPVPKLLELNEWKPHQDLVEEGSLKKQNDIPKDSKVVFCSHQWTSFMHPDPEAEQLQALKDLLTKLMQGQTDVRANGALRLKYKQDLKTTGEEWKEMLPKAYVWFDYVSMPQPLAGGGGVHLKSAMASGEAGPGPHAGLSDHRHSANDDDQDLVENLKLAVDSIPSYIERCDYMWVLVPPCKHNDLGEDSVCDFNSWRQRGWCRMEYGAAKLKRSSDMPIMVVKAINKMDYVHPCDLMKLAPATGAFSVDEDRQKVLTTLDLMCRQKVDYLHQAGDPTLALFQGLFSPLWLGTIVSSYQVPVGDAPLEGQAAVDAMRVRLGLSKLSPTEEAAFFKRTGWSLLTCATACNDLAATTYLLTDAEQRATICKVPRQFKPSMAHHSMPSSMLLTHFAGCMNALGFAMWLGSAELLAAVLAAAPAALPNADKNMLALFMPLTQGKIAHLDVFLQKYAIELNQPLKGDWSGMTFLHVVCMWGAAPHQATAVRWLLERGADPAHRGNTMGLTPLMCLASNAEAELESVDLLKAAVESRGGKFVDHLQLADQKNRVMRTMSGAAKLAASLGFGKAAAMVDMFEQMAYGGTALHRAAERGDAAMAKVLLDQGADPNARCEKRLTPLQRTESALPNSHAAPLLEKTISRSSVFDVVALARAAAAGTTDADTAAAAAPVPSKASRWRRASRDALRLGAPQVAPHTIAA